MNQKNTLLAKIFIPGIILFVLLASSNSLICQSKMEQIENSKVKNLYETKQAFWNTYNEIMKDVPQKDRRAWKQFQRWSYFWQARVFPTGNFPDPKIFVKQFKQTLNENKNNKIQSTNTWTLLGPTTNPEGTGSTREQGLGRINVVRFHPTDGNTYWVGSASGGVWKTTDNGINWTTYPFTQFLSIGVSDIAIDPKNPDIIYVATGDCEPASGKNFYTIGIIKTTNGGTDWFLTNYTSDMEDGNQVARILINPNNTQELIVGTSQGISKSTDGGNSWVSKQKTGFFKDLEFKPDDPNIIYAATQTWGGNSSIYKSIDLGETWKSVKTYSRCVRIALAVTPSDPNYVFALGASSSTRGFHSLFISSDAGSTWEEVLTPSNHKNILGWYDGGSSDQRGQGEYDLALAVNPKDINELYSGGINIWKSTSMGGDFKLNTGWTDYMSKPYVHADIHDLQYHPLTNHIYATCDGGISRSTDKGTTWKDITDGISITQYYKMGQSATVADMIVGGCQDNGTSLLTGGVWKHVYAGDGMDCAIDPTDPQKVYVSMYYGNLYKSTNGGSNFVRLCDTTITHEEGDWITPYVIDPNKTSTLYAGYINMWKTTNYGANWLKISDFTSSAKLQLIAVAPSNSNTIYCCTYGALYANFDGGATKTWTNILSSSSALTGITVDPNNDKRIWVSKSGYNATDKVQYYDGTNWMNITGNLPNVPINTIVVQVDPAERLYIGTDIGVFTCDNNSGYWEKYGGGLPNVVVNELEIHKATNKLRAATYGRGVWETELNMCNVAIPKVTVTGKTEFCDGDSCVLEAQDGYASYLWTTGETSRKITVKKEGYYSVAGYDQTGCRANSDGITISVLLYPELTIKPQNTSICEGDSVVLTASFGFKTYKWSTGETDIKKIGTKTPGTYWVECEYSNGCKTKATYELVFNPPPTKPIITQFGNTLYSNSTVAVKYQWYFNDNLITGATNATFVVSELGLYRVEITDANGCVNISDTFDVKTSVEDATKGEIIKIVPNPSTGIFNLNIQNLNGFNFDIDITNIVGVKIYTEQVNYSGGEFHKTIDLSKYPTGVYFVNIKYNGKVWTTKLVKE